MTSRYVQYTDVDEAQVYATVDDGYIPLVGQEIGLGEGRDYAEFIVKNVSHYIRKPMSEYVHSVAVLLEPKQ